MRAAPTDGFTPVDIGESTGSETAVGGLLDRLPGFVGVPRTLAPLTGGLTNHNFQVVTPNGRYVARMPSSHGTLLAIDREAEFRNSQAAHRAGVAPKVVAYLPAHEAAIRDGSPTPHGSAGHGSIMVIDWVEGYTWSAADVRTNANLPRIAASCRALHSGPRFVNDFNMFDVQRRYLSIVTERGFRLPPRYRDFAPLVARIEQALAVCPQRTVACHNDLLAENFIDDGQRLWLIDYEYAGNNDPYFELGNIASESGMSVDQLAELVRWYRGSDSPALIARARLWGLMSQYGWTLWASIQDAVSDLDFDFWSWGMEKYDRAVATFDGAELSRWLVDVQQPE